MHPRRLAREPTTVARVRADADADPDGGAAWRWALIVASSARSVSADVGRVGRVLPFDWSLARAPTTRQAVRVLLRQRGAPP